MRILGAIIEYGTVLFVFLIPWQARFIIAPGSINGEYWEYGTQSLYASEVLLGVVLVAAIGKFLVAAHRNALVRKWRFDCKRLVSPSGAFALAVLWAGFSVLWSLDRAVALEHWIVLVEMGALFLVLSSGVIQFSRIAWAVVSSAALQSIFALCQFAAQSIPASTIAGMASQSADMLGASVVETANGRWLRAYGSFPHPNMLGGWLVLGLLLAVKEAKHTPLAYIAVALMSVGLAITFSRGAWIAFGVGLAAWLVVKKCREFFLPLAVMALFVGMLVIAYPEPFQERVFGGGRLEAKSTQERSAGIREALQIIKQHPLVGAGIGNYGLAVHRDIDSSQFAYYYQPVHNVPLLILAELGAIGLLLMIVFLLSLRGAARSLLAKSGDAAILSSREGLMSGAVFLLPLIIIALFDHYLWSLYAGIMMGIVYLAIFYLKLAKK